jgi:transcription elongation factor Elf1
MAGRRIAPRFGTVTCGRCKARFPIEIAFEDVVESVARAAMAAGQGAQIKETSMTRHYTCPHCGVRNQVAIPAVMVL